MKDASNSKGGWIFFIFFLILLGLSIYFLFSRAKSCTVDKDCKDTQKCIDKKCVNAACSSSNKTGKCAGGQVCKNGVCACQDTMVNINGVDTCVKNPIVIKENSSTPISLPPNPVFATYGSVEKGTCVPKDVTSIVKTLIGRQISGQDLNGYFTDVCPGKEKQLLIYYQ